jgi:NIMA-interacting peptidyl-prolyl cis-trans isomerase 1
MSTTRRKPYFYNRDTNQSLWEPPQELSRQEVDNLPGAELLSAPPPPPGGANSVRASHLLVKHRDSRRPSSWKEVSPYISLEVYFY